MKKQPFKGTIRILPELRDLIQPLTAEQRTDLEQALVEEGQAYNPLWLWGDILVDGHHRYDICTKLKLPYEVRQVYQSAETLEDVMYRMMRDAISQRNLPLAVTSLLRAKMVSHRVNKGEGKKEAVKAVAKETNVSERQVYRDVSTAEDLEKIDESVKPATDTMSATAIKKLAAMPKPKQRAVAKKAGGDGKKITKAVQEEPKKAAGSKAEQSVENAELLKEIVNTLQTAKRKCTAVEEMPGTELFLARQQSIGRCIEEAKDAVKVTIPHSVCSRCNGRGCAHCGNHGWVNAVMAKELENGK